MEKGELPSRDDDHLWLAYYIKHKDGYIHADSLWRGYWGIADRNSIKQVLAPVPSYEEWKQLKEYERIVTSYNMKPIDYDIACETVNKLLDERKALKEQNAQLKELLKEWMQFEIEENPNDFTVMSERMSELTNKTKEVLK